MVCGVNHLESKYEDADKMAKVCYFTGRKTVSGNNRSHAMNKTKRAVKPNLQKVTILVNGKPKKVWASARALKSGKVERV